MSLEEISAGKLCALLDRAMPRDLYDTARLPKIAGAVLESSKFRALFMTMAAVMDHPLHAYGYDRLERVTDEDVRSQLHPMLSRDERPTADALRNAARQLAAPFLSLSEREREFVDRIQYGDVEPALLFPDEPDMVERLRTLPALLWKAKNAREHAARG
jgi:Nucleotidyl transferase AbiEii toxin, Type IV TA system